MESYRNFIGSDETVELRHRQAFDMPEAAELVLRICGIPRKNETSEILERCYRLISESPMLGMSMNGILFMMCEGQNSPNY